MYSVIAQGNGRQVAQRLLADVDKNPLILSKALSRLAYFGQLDAREAMKKELDRPKQWSLRAINYKKAKRSDLVSSVYVNPRNDYLHFQVFGGTRKAKKRFVFIPERGLRTDKHGNLSFTRRKNLVKSRKTFRITKGGKTFLMNRKGKRKLRLVAYMPNQTRYTKKEYKFHDSALRTYDRRFAYLFNKEYDKVVARR